MKQRGPKPTTRRLAPRDPLPVDPPAELRLAGRAKTVYRQLAQRLAVEGYVGAADARLVGLAAATVLSVERLENEVASLAELTVVGSQGQTRPHPLLAELRSERRELAALLHGLFMSPRSRSASRLSEAQLRQAQAPDEFTAFLSEG